MCRDIGRGPIIVSQAEAALAVAGITAAITAIGWLVTYLYTKRREDRTRRIEATLKYSERQIEELYGPLLSLIEQIFTVWRVRERLLRDDSSLAPERRTEIREIIWNRFFHPIHEEMNALLKTKLHLVENGDLPPSFQQYLQHVMQEACQHELSQSLNTFMATAHIPWPQEFYPDVQKSLRLIRKRHDACLNNLDPKGTIFSRATMRAGGSRTPSVRAATSEYDRSELA